MGMLTADSSNRIAPKPDQIIILRVEGNPYERDSGLLQPLAQGCCLAVPPRSRYGC